jgi:isoleucyl-tRNA synthetase
MDARDYRDTVHLPRTDFPMRAQLAEREPQQIEAWEKSGLYEKILAANQEGGRFVLHDGPPYANGSLHQGHFLNKILKDIVGKVQSMSGKRADIVPGWDCHGLPIEQQVDKQLGAKKRELTPAQFRRACRAYAESQVEVQRREFQRLGVFMRWSDPYLTMSYGYEAQTVRELAAITRAGALYRRKRPVHWCARDATALAEAEVEYAPHKSPSIYVKFDVTEAGSLLADVPQLAGKKLALPIWTTTPWTLPANLAIAAHPEIDYVVYDLNDTGLVVARDLLASFLAACGPDELVEGQPLLKHHVRVLAHLKGSQLAGLKYRHPLLDRTSPVVLGEHPTTEAGTGLVHTAPGHGEDDYQMGLRYGLPIFAPVDSHGKFTAEAGLGLEGKKIFDANPEIVEKLIAAGALLNAGGKAGVIEHSYPHCWRCKQPVIFRATDQWWIALDQELALPGRGRTTIRKAALEAVDRLASEDGWVPAWGKDRIRGMVENRPDWCISRQRQWGVPIPVGYCGRCHEPLVSAEAMEHVAGFFEKEGADAWFDRPLSELLPKESKCNKCGFTEFTKETDILDVWFDSGSSFAVVLASGRWPGLGVPADLYLEGSDQHRGWFMSSLVIGIATRGEAPYKRVLTHGFVVAEDGRKMSKSLGNYVDPQQALKKYGAEVFRLWVAASDYRDDVRLSNNILEQLSEGYRKIRNTLRYCASQLFDFDPAKDSVADAELEPVDRWALSRFEAYRAEVLQAYQRYELHRVYHATVELCATDLSAFYFDVLKDRTYCSGKSWRERRAAQTVLYKIGRDLCRLLAPIASFTAEEAWQHLPAPRTESVFLAGLPRDEGALDEDLLEQFALLRSVRQVVNAELERQRVAKIFGKSSEAEVVVRVRHPPEADDLLILRQLGEVRLADLFLVAKVTLEAEPLPADQVGAGPGLSRIEVSANKSAHPACARCWRALADVGQDATHPTLCARCVRAVSEART